MAIIQLISKLRVSDEVRSAAASKGPAPPVPGHGRQASGQIKMEGARGSGSTVHTINEDERTEFTRHINACLLGDADIGDRLPFPTDTFQMFDECKGIAFTLS